MVPDTIDASDQFTPARKKQISQLNRNSASPVISPTRLEQEEIDRIVDLIIHQLRNVKEGEIPIDLSEQKQNQRVCSCCRGQPIINCTHYHNHFETKAELTPTSKLQSYLGKLDR